jgi:integrase
VFHSFDDQFLIQGLKLGQYLNRSLHEVQKILGHTQIKTTQRYAHLSQDTLIDAANVVPFKMDLPMVCLASAAGVSLSNSLR